MAAADTLCRARAAPRQPQWHGGGVHAAVVQVRGRAEQLWVVLFFKYYIPLAIAYVPLPTEAGSSRRAAKASAEAAEVNFTLKAH